MSATRALAMDMRVGLAASAASPRAARCALISATVYSSAAATSPETGGATETGGTAVGAGLAPAIETIRTHVAVGAGTSATLATTIRAGVGLALAATTAAVAAAEVAVAAAAGGRLEGVAATGAAPCGVSV